MVDVAQVLAAEPTPVLPAGAEERKRRGRIAEALIMQGLDTSPVGSWTQGAARLAQVLAGSMDERSLNQDERGAAQRMQDLLLANPVLGGSPKGAPTGSAPESMPGTLPATAPAAASPSVPVPSAGAGVPPNAAISSIESGGRYDAVGQPIPKTGDRAFGKYQVMGANIPEWTREHVGREMTPQEFLASPEAQEAVFKGQFGKYTQKYGPEGAARAWFAGEGGMNDLTRRDPLGTSVADYSRKFQTASLGKPGAVPAAAAAPGVPEGVADTFQPSMPGTLPATAPGAPPAAAAPAAVTPGAGAPARMQTQMDPSVQAYVKKLIATGDPGAIALANGITAQYSKPATLKSVVVDGKIYNHNEATGELTLAADTGKREFAPFEGGRVLEKGTGQVTTPASAAGYRPLVDPAARAAQGIPPTDNRPYQVDAAGKLINPPAETRINIDQKAEGAFESHGAQYQAKRFDDLVKQSYDAKGMVADLNYLRDIGSRITTGKTAQIAESLGPYAEALGVKIDGLSDLQAYQAVVARLQPRMRVAGSGATSDYEMKTFLQALPSLGKTPEGNAIIANTLEALQQQHLAAGEIASRALAGDIKRADAEKQLRELADPFELWKKSRGAAPSARVPPPNGFQVVQ